MGLLRQKHLGLGTEFLRLNDINVLYFDFDLRDIETIRQASFILMKHVTHLDGIWSSQDCVLRPFKETPSLQPYTPMIAEIMSL